MTGVLNSQVAEIKRCQNQRVSFDWDDCEYVALERMYEWRAHVWFKMCMSIQHVVKVYMCSYMSECILHICTYVLCKYIRIY